jgi:hypothetical protein
LTFDIRGDRNGEEVLTAGYYGYLAGIRIGDTIVNLEHGEPAILNGVELTFSFRVLSFSTVLLSLHATNNGGESQRIDMGVVADVNIIIDNKFYDEAPAAKLPNGHGFSLFAGPMKFTFVTAGYPLVDNVSTFWFGWFWDRNEARFTQVVNDTYDARDTAMAYTWQGLELRQGGKVSRSVIARFGEFQVNPVSLSVDLKATEAAPQTRVKATGNAVAITAGTGSTLRIWVSVDGETSQLTEVEGSFHMNAAFLFDFVPEKYGLTQGIHTIEFYGVGPDGDVSLPSAHTVTIRPDATPTEEGSSLSAALGPVIGGTLGGIAVVVVFIAVAYFFSTRRRRKNDAKLGSDSGAAVHAYGDDDAAQQV